MSTDAYLDAKDSFERADRAIKEFGQFITEVGRNLMQNPGRFIFSNCQPGLPMEASMSRDSVSVNANDWRSPQQIQEIIAQWHELRSAMYAAWDNVPLSRRDGLKPPPGPGR
jgi:hypothetical protein